MCEAGQRPLDRSDVRKAHPRGTFAAGQIHQLAGRLVSSDLRQIESERVGERRTICQHYRFPTWSVQRISPHPSCTGIFELCILLFQSYNL